MRKLLVYLNHLARDSFAGVEPLAGKPRRPGSYWSAEDRNRLHLLRQAGVPRKLIALELGRSEPSVFKQIRMEEKRRAGAQMPRPFVKAYTAELDSAGKMNRPFTLFTGAKRGAKVPTVLPGQRPKSSNPSRSR